MAEAEFEKQLKLWSLGDSIKTLKDHGINNMTLLAAMDENLILELFPDQKDTRRLMFLDKWIKFVAKKGERQIEWNSDMLKNALYSIIDEGGLERVLWNNFESKAILICYDREKKLSNKDSDKIVEIITVHCLNISFEWTSLHYAVISKNLVTIFPTEHIRTYYVSAIAKADSITGESQVMQGKIPNCFKNRKNAWNAWTGCSKKRKSKGQMQEEAKKARLADQPENIQKSVQTLKNEGSSKPEVLEAWTETTSYREQWIQQNKNPTIEIIIENWPPLTGDDMPLLIDMDFTANHSKLMIGKGITCFEQMMGVLCSEFECVSDDTVGRGLKDAIDLVDTSEDGRVLGQLAYLTHLFPPKGNMKSGKEKETTKERISATESLDSLILLDKDAEVLAAKKKKRQDDAGRAVVQPYLMVLGDHITKPTKISIVINEYEYTVASARDAIDVMFKIFRVLNVYYPPASCHIWYLLEQGVYGMENRTTRAFTWMSKALLALKNNGFLLRDI